MMKKVYHVEGKELVETEYTPNMDINDGDVYAFDQGDVIWIWIGKDSSVEESTVGAWFTNKLDEERDGTPEVLTINQNEEPMPFKENFKINVVDADTPGFLRKAELDTVEYKLTRIYTEAESMILDEVFVEEIDIDRENLKSEDVYVLDGNEAVYCWIGNDANIEEKRMGQKVIQKIDADRHYLPIQYTIYEGEESKSEKAFYELLEKISKMKLQDRVTTSVEDKRETGYKPEAYETAEEHRERTEKTYETTKPEEKPERSIIAGTEEHLKTIKGIHASDEGLPPQGTVSARISEINQRSWGEEPDKKEVDKVREKVVTSRDDSAENTGPIYRGEDTSIAIQARIDQRGAKSEEKIKKTCVAIDMHSTIWKANKSCSVCGMGPDDCSASEAHRRIWGEGMQCSVCLAKP